ITRAFGEARRSAKGAKAAGPLPRRSDVEISSNWWETFFDGVAVDMWVKALTPEQNEQEAALIARMLDVPPGSELLDVPCGAGRLAIALAASGFRVTGVDLSPAFLDRARAADPAATVR